ncbi:MAG: cardiolipin synthase [Tannerella sp.]|jgi:cardiolipin synthase|nr:cardiolipin synthase [Tannerella sp.]
MDISTLIGSLFVVLYSITIIGLVSLVVLENRNPLKTIPWVLVLIFVPGIGLAVYYFFGQDNRRLHIISRRIYKRFRRQVKLDIQPGSLQEVPPDYLPLANLLKHSSYSAIFGGCEISFFTNGSDKFDRLIEDIRAARHHIHLQYYIFNDDETGHKVRRELISKAREGVLIRVLYDDVGCWDTKHRFFEEMKSAGIEVYPYLKVVFPILTGKVNYRNHRKVVVIDGRVGYMGGMNIADRYVLGNKLGVWRDTHFRITGAGVYGLQASFLLDWYSMSRNIVKGREFFPATPASPSSPPLSPLSLTPSSTSSDLKMQIVTSGPTNMWPTLMQGYIYCITNAKRYIYIQTPYFLPTEALNQALTMAALGGIDVRLMIPRRSDTLSAQLATLSYVEKMLQSGVKVFLYDKGFLHSKLLLIDDMLTCFGSSNFDFRSFEHNFELNAFVYQTDFALRMKQMFTDDMADCREVSYPEWRRRPLPVRLAESFMRLFAPLL